jgi:hypothetical protein
VINRYNILKKSGVFRLIIPDMEFLLKEYMKSKENDNSIASIDFKNSSLLGMELEPKGLGALVRNLFGNSRHLWLWDKDSTFLHLKKSGFINI